MSVSSLVCAQILSASIESLRINDLLSLMHQQKLQTTATGSLHTFADQCVFLPNSDVKQFSHSLIFFSEPCYDKSRFTCKH